MLNATFLLNDDLNGIEITFASKPDGDILMQLKGAGFRWHRVKKIWYAKQNAERLALAEQISTGSTETTPAPKKVAEVETGKIDTSGLENYKISCWGSDFTKIMREELKKRGARGVTVRMIHSCDAFAVTIQLNADDFRSVEETAERLGDGEIRRRFDRGVYYNNMRHNASELDGLTEEQFRTVKMDYVRGSMYKLTEINKYHMEPEDYPQLTVAALERIRAIYKIANAWNYNHSDSMSDYFEVGYYLDIDIKLPKDFAPVENMTDDERAALQAERIAAEEKRKADFERMEREREEARKESERLEKIRREQCAEIEAHVTVKDFAENEQLFITNLIEGAEKDCNIKEVRETAKRYPANIRNAQIDRAVYFTDERIFNNFCNMLLDNFSFLAGMGGTGSEDVRLENVPNLYSLNNEQRQSVEWYTCKAVAVYLNGELMLVSDPQGYNYSRYTLMPTETTETAEAAPVLSRMAEPRKGSIIRSGSRKRTGHKHSE